MAEAKVENKIEGKGQNHCPKCGSDNLDYGEPNVDGKDFVWYSVKCNDCYCLFQETYTQEYYSSVKII